MTLVKNTTLAVGMLMLLMGFAFSSTPALAAMHTSDACIEDETAEADEDNLQEENDSEVDDDAKDTAEDACEQAESDSLASDAKISEAKARAIAESNYTGNGTITEILLGLNEEDDGVNPVTSSLLYDIKFTTSDGSDVDVQVDAMTGEYLGIEADDEEESDEADDEVEGNNSNSSDVRSLQTQLLSLLQQLMALLKA